VEGAVDVPSPPDEVIAQGDPQTSNLDRQFCAKGCSWNGPKQTRKQGITSPQKKGRRKLFDWSNV